MYEWFEDIDVFVRKVDLEQGRVVGDAIMLPAIHRVNAVTISDGRSRMGFKQLEPGNYAIIGAWTGAYVSLSDSCFGDDAIVFSVSGGQIGVLPLSYYRIADMRYSEPRTGEGREGASLTRARRILNAYSNVDAPVTLLEIIARVRIPPTSGLFGETCGGSGEVQILNTAK